MLTFRLIEFSRVVLSREFSSALELAYCSGGYCKSQIMVLETVPNYCFMGEILSSKLDTKHSRPS
jgi:hypothetical protein